MVEGKFLLVSDLDGTLLGCDVALEKFAAWLSTRRDHFQVVYNSGRLIDSVRRSVADLALPEPDAIIGGVGTEIELFESGEAVDGWPEFLHGHWDHALVREVLDDEPRLKLQPERFLSERKVSYLADSATSEDLMRWQFKLQMTGLSVRLVYSSHRDLDFLPKGCDKGTATAFLAKRWGYLIERVISCGDTANDCAMFAQGFLGVVVSNALDELRMLDAPHIYHAEASHAGGVLEGICHWLDWAEQKSVSCTASQ